MRLRYHDIVCFPVTLVPFVALPVDIEYRDLSSAVVNTSSGLSCCLVPADFKVAAASSLPRALSEATALLLHHHHDYSQACHAKALHSCNNTTTKTQSETLLTKFSFSQPWWRPSSSIRSSVPTSSRSPTHPPIFNQHLAYCAPEPQHQYPYCTIYWSSVIRTLHTTAKAGTKAHLLLRQMSPAYL